MKPSLLCCTLGLGVLFAATTSDAAVEYVKVCSVYGAGFNYLSGTDVCVNAATGDARQQTEAGTWRSLLPYPEGKWVTLPQLECGFGRLVTLGSFASGDFLPNAWNRKQTQGVPVNMRSGEFVSKVMMSGGFYDPRLPVRHGTNGSDGLCVRSTDPGTMQNGGQGPFNPPFGNGMLPIGCVANSRIVGMPATYSVGATSAYPSVDAYFVDGEQTVSGPYTYGSRLVVTTDFGTAAQTQLTYFDVRNESTKPLAGRVTVSVCVEQGSVR